MPRSLESKIECMVIDYCKIQPMLILRNLHNGSCVNEVLVSGLIAAINEAHQLYSVREIWYM